MEVYFKHSKHADDWVYTDVTHLPRVGELVCLIEDGVSISGRVFDVIHENGTSVKR